jgi:hypothetical protein
MIDSSSKLLLLQIQGRWYQERKQFYKVQTTILHPLFDGQIPGFGDCPFLD